MEEWWTEELFKKQVLMARGTVAGKEGDPARQQDASKSVGSV